MLARMMPFVAESGVGGRGRQRAAREQAAGAQQHERQRDLPDDQRRFAR